MGPDYFNISANRQADLTFEVVWEDDNLVPIDLAGYTAELKVMDRNEDTVMILNTETYGGLTIGPTDTTVLYVEATADQMKALPYPNEAPIPWRYELVVTSPGNIAYALMEGQFILDDGVPIP